MLARLIGAVVALLLFVGPAAAQQDQLEAEIADIQTRYEQAWTGGDADALADLFTADAVLWPFSGGSFEGREQIRQALQSDPTPTAAEIGSNRTERIGDLVVDIGTFTFELPEQGGTVEGEYVAVLEESDDGLKLHRLAAFPPRRPPQEQ